MSTHEIKIHSGIQFKGASDADHVVAFTAEDDSFVARCCCGWDYKYTFLTSYFDDSAWWIIFREGVRHTKSASAEAAS